MPIVILPQNISCPFNLQSVDKIKDIKNQIAIKMNIPFNDLSFYFKYKYLDEDQELSAYKLEDNSVIKCFVRKPTKVVMLRSKEIIDNGGFMRIETIEVDKDKETALSAFKALIRGNNKDKLRTDQFENLMLRAETLQPKLIKTILNELNLQHIDQLDEQKFLAYFKTEIANY